LKEHTPLKGFENRIVTVSGFKLCEALSKIFTHKRHAQE
jgi:hypothetical protein